MGTLKNTYIPGLITNLSPDEKLCFQRCMLPPYWKHLISALDFLPRREEGSSWRKNWYVFAAWQHFYGLSLKELEFRQEARGDQKLAHAELNPHGDATRCGDTHSLHTVVNKIFPASYLFLYWRDNCGQKQFGDDLLTSGMPNRDRWPSHLRSRCIEKLVSCSRNNKSN